MQTISRFRVWESNAQVNLPSGSSRSLWTFPFLCPRVSIRSNEWSSKNWGRGRMSFSLLRKLPEKKKKKHVLSTTEIWSKGKYSLSPRKCISLGDSSTLSKNRLHLILLSPLIPGRESSPQLKHSSLKGTEETLLDLHFKVINYKSVNRTNECIDRTYKSYEFC